MSRWARLACGLASAAMPARPGHRVLVYHSIVDQPWHDADEMTVSRARLEAQLDAMGRRVGVVPLEAGRAGTVSLTFDDGFSDNVTLALPVLARRGLTATLFVIVEAVGASAFRHLPAPPAGRQWARPVGWDELRRWVGAGFGIGLHGWDHTAFTAQAPAVLRPRLERGRKTLEDRLGIRVEDLAYPYGDYPHFDGDLAAMVAAMGFRRAYTLVAGRNAGRTPPTVLRRIRMSEWDDDELVGRKVEGRFDFLGAYQRLRHAVKRPSDQEVRP